MCQGVVVALTCGLPPAQAAHNDSVQANKSIQGRMFDGQVPDKAVTTAYNPTAMLY